jgi:hypothetical protein
MEKRQYIVEPTEMSPLQQAQQAANWLPVYLYSDDAEHGLLPQVGAQRLEDLFGDKNTSTNLSRLKKLFAQIAEEQQAPIGLYVAGYSEEAIAALSETPLADALDGLRRSIECTARLGSEHTADTRWSSGNGVHIPLKTVTDLLSQDQHISEETLNESCSAIQKLSSDTLQQRLGWVRQYLPASSADEWLRLTCDWLDGTPLTDLAQLYGLKNITVGQQLERIAKVLLREPTTASRRSASIDADLRWQDDAYCLGGDTEIFFPEKGGSAREARKMCDKCKVKEQCVDYAVRHKLHFGIWGGRSENERRGM